MTLTRIITFESYTVRERHTFCEHIYFYPLHFYPNWLETLMNEWKESLMNTVKNLWYLTLYKLTVRVVYFLFIIIFFFNLQPVKDQWDMYVIIFFIDTRKSTPWRERIKKKTILPSPKIFRRTITRHAQDRFEVGFLIWLYSLLINDGFYLLFFFFWYVVIWWHCLIYYYNL